MLRLWSARNEWHKEGASEHESIKSGFRFADKYLERRVFFVGIILRRLTVLDFYRDNKNIFNWIRSEPGTMTWAISIGAITYNGITGTNVDSDGTWKAGGSESGIELGVDTGVSYLESKERASMVMLLETRVLHLIWCLA